MPPKKAKKGTSSQTQRAIKQTQAAVEQAAQHQIAQYQQQDSQEDTETQVPIGSQPVLDDQPTDEPDSANNTSAEDALASTADGNGAAGTPDTEVSADDVTLTGDDAKDDDKKEDAASSEKRTRKRKRDPSNFKAYIHIVLKQLDSHQSMSKNGAQVMNDFVKDTALRIAETARDMCKKQKKVTLQAHDIQSATKLILPGQLGSHAAKEGLRALRTFNSTTGHLYR